ncbi:DNA-3-methyladenine glycosylase I [Novipirellula artificiosorum]|uniref:DNA-3-methyladenine glycosylase 1 n=1 Tax=Novipirellula artificiosorum TaxID=2528016 RepID=A0A5C6DAW1_9BACT|nr:DNA-3-methyladenine glycosylase I [Novipirellula artificiosorum]TWU32867.1 DNA-3-methyladenine glycosylase 1 [Novipirellula artificiosorum]
MKQDDSLITGSDDLRRCWWCGSDPLYIQYHDQQWGFPVDDDRKLFEKICLEGFQAGLSWWTILRKRESFREAFAGFDFEQVATFTSRHVDQRVQQPAIVRHRGKIESTINNAQQAIALVEEFGSLAAYFWQYEPKRKSPPKTRQQIVASTPESTAMSKDLKRRGWSFIGPTTCYAFMQAMGLVNDHLKSCCRYETAKLARDAFTVPR